METLLQVLSEEEKTQVHVYLKCNSYSNQRSFKPLAIGSNPIGHTPD
ncbi:MAG: hypothetical protein QF816_05815 [Candidatus Scalindua sp.]|nr:hypothetical protein [Candidatus Scalindua sp.]